MNTTKQNLSANQTDPGIKFRNLNGDIQPPRNSTVMSADMANRYTYSASIKKAQRKPVYSVWYPATSSDSDSGRSNGVRLNSAVEAMMKMIKPIGCSKINQPCA